MRAELEVHGPVSLPVFPVSCSIEMSGEKKSQPYNVPWNHLLTDFPTAMDCVPSNSGITYIFFPLCYFTNIIFYEKKEN